MTSRSMLDLNRRAHESERIVGSAFPKRNPSRDRVDLHFGLRNPKSLLRLLQRGLQLLQPVERRAGSDEVPQASSPQSFREPRDGFGLGILVRNWAWHFELHRLPPSLAFEGIACRQDGQHDPYAEPLC